jgi:hypothetical protein
MTLSLGARAAMLDGFETYMVSGSGQATLTVYQTNTALCVFNLGASSTGTPFGSAVLDSLSLSSTLSLPLSNTGTAVAGTANRFVIATQNSATALTGSIGAIGSGADIELPALTVTAAATQTLNALILRMDAYGDLTTVGSLTLQ